MIIRVEKRHVVYVASVCGILNEGGKKSPCYTFPKLQNIQLHPGSPSPPPFLPGAHTPSVPLPRKWGAGGEKGRSTRPPCFPLESCSSLRTPAHFCIRKGSSPSLRCWFQPSPYLSLPQCGPGRLLSRFPLAAPQT